MRTTTKRWVAWRCVPISARVLAGGNSAPPDHHARRCQSHAASRFIGPQGTMLWGGWTEKERTHPDGRKSVLASTSLDGTSLKLEGGRLAGGKRVVGSVLQGTSSDGQPVKAGTSDLGGGDRCALERAGENAPAGMLRNLVGGNEP